MQTFVVRVYQGDGDAARGPELRGVVDEVATGASATFRDGDELLRILVGQAVREVPTDRSRDDR
jgi:hypothetical protein